MRSTAFFTVITPQPRSVQLTSVHSRTRTRSTPPAAGCSRLHLDDVRVTHTQDSHNMSELKSTSHRLTDQLLTAVGVEGIRRGNPTGILPRHMKTLTLNRS